MQKVICISSAWLLALASGSAVAEPIVAEKVEAAFVAEAAIAFNGELISASRVQDNAGQHVLILSKKIGPSKVEEDVSRDERADLQAGYYLKTATGWAQEWAINDAVDCPGLDFMAAFFTRYVTFTDLNNDGVAEVTVPYRLFCGGGVDPATLKVILRNGAQKLAIRGESRIVMQGVEPFGGEKHDDDALLLPENAAFKAHLNAVWSKVYVEHH